MTSVWSEETASAFSVIRPTNLSPGLLVAFSGRGVAPGDCPSPTAFLTRRFAQALGHPDLPIVSATQVHGVRVARVEETPAAGEVRDAGECDILVTRLSGVALVVQAADCVPMVLVSSNAVAAAHAGWRGLARGAAASAARALRATGAAPESLQAWLGPSIRPCCYEVSNDVASQFSPEFVRTSHDGHDRLDLAAAACSQLEAAGVNPANILVHAACTKCGGERFASFRRDGAEAGRMIALVARVAAREGAGQ